MPIIRDILPYSDICGVRWHKPSQNYIAEIGYHRITRIAADGTVKTKRIRTTHYLGSLRRREEAEAKYAAIKEQWRHCVAEQRKLYDEENANRRSAGLPSLPRFKPEWPKTTVHRESSGFKPGRKIVSPSTASQPSQLPLDPKTMYDLTIRAARDRYVADLRKRIGLQNGKGINKNTFEKSVQSLDLSLALNEGYRNLSRQCSGLC